MIWHRAAVVFGTCTALLMALAPAARAADPVTVAVDGPSSIPVVAREATLPYWATFTIMDPSKVATSIVVCGPWLRGQNECDALPLAPRRYGNGEPAITAIPGGWQFRWRVAYRYVSNELCWNSTFSKESLRATLSVHDASDAVLAQGEYTYRLACAGLVAAADGPKYLKVYANKNSKSITMDFYLLDTYHVAKSFRTCAYSSLSGDFTLCKRYHLTRSSAYYTDYGWHVTKSFRWGPVGASLCSYIGRKWPQAGSRVNFYDINLNPLASYFHSLRLECG